MEKVIRMTKPAHNESFGFSIMGGKEHGSPIYVEYVTAGEKIFIQNTFNLSLR